MGHVWDVPHFLEVARGPAAEWGEEVSRGHGGLVAKVLGNLGGVMRGAEPYRPAPEVLGGVGREGAIPVGHWVESKKDRGWGWGRKGISSMQITSRVYSRSPNSHKGTKRYIAGHDIMRLYNTVLHEKFSIE